MPDLFGHGRTKGLEVCDGERRGGERRGEERRGEERRAEDRTGEGTLKAPRSGSCWAPEQALGVKCQPLSDGCRRRGLSGQKGVNQAGHSETPASSSSGHKQELLEPRFSAHVSKKYCFAGSKHINLVIQ